MKLVEQSTYYYSTAKSFHRANVIPWGADSTVLLPRFINIKRGMYISYVLGLIIFPWRILRSATTFLQFLGGYSIFLGPFVGIFLTDYLVCRRGNIYLQDLYTPEGRYWYRHGIHWRAVVAYIVAVVLPIPGFARTFDIDVPVEMLRIYQVGWLFTCVLSSIIYWGLSLVGDFAVHERDMTFELISAEQLEPFLGTLDALDEEIKDESDAKDS
jgi:nucleobase:cation symporter-1, NCS1 family